jgi:threonine synthase
MQYYSTNGKAPLATLEEAVVRGLAPDKGLYMPQEIRPLPQEFFRPIVPPCGLPCRRLI